MKHAYTVHRPESAITAERREQDHYDRPRGTTLGAGCCDWCGRPWEKCECTEIEDPIVAAWRAGFAAKVAEVRTKRRGEVAGQSQFSSAFSRS